MRVHTDVHPPAHTHACTPARTLTRWCNTTELTPSCHPGVRCHASQNLPNGSTRVIAVAASNAAGRSPLSPAVQLSTWPGSVPAQPAKPVLVAFGSDGWSESQGFSPATSINIRWHRPYDFEQQITTYRVMLSSAGDANFDTPRAFSYGYNRAASMSRVLPSYRCTNTQPSVNPSLRCLKPATNYSVRVAAANVEGYSPYSEPLTFTTGPPEPPDRPIPIVQAALPPSLNPITWMSIRWEEPPSVLPITGYRVRRSADDGEHCTGRALTDSDSCVEENRLIAPSDRSWLHEVSPNTTYSYQVQAINEFADSVPSLPVVLRTAMPIPPFKPMLEHAVLPASQYPTVRSGSQCTARLPHPSPHRCS